MSLTFSKPQEVNWEAPEFDLSSTDGNNYKLTDFFDKKGLLIVFTCNHCPYAKASWPIIIEYSKKYINDIRFIAINSNDSSMHEEDSFEGMINAVRDMNIQFPYLHDETQEVAKAYNALCTPDPYLFKVENSKAKLFFRGRINDNWQVPKSATKWELADSIERLIEGESPLNEWPPSMGCSIKWK